ncbi:hypothetical protein AGOR_G00041750 [Albula goreensis]|uniref:Uncharacterized protein n=1 Tax=Albula goreensis TaxID=1534307 RepID=A0A8T3DYQ0_9TELE|nr:hypothetical protein AGOR_G00041750 [Albula goreensis]
MQEESGESVCRDSSVLVWPCPLCQQERPDRDALTQHLTEKHSVLPACLDRLLDTATPAKAASGNRVEKANTQNDSDTPSSQQMPSEMNGAPSDLSETDPNTAGPKQGIVSTYTLRRSGVKVDSCPEEDTQRDGETMQGGGRDDLDQGQESAQLPESSTTTGTQKGSFQLGTSNDSDSDSTTNSTSTSKTHSDPALEKFLDPTRPFKCNACLESFTSKSALGVHYSSTSHLHRMRTGSSLQGDEKDTSSSTSPATTPYLSRPFFSNKPYQCAVCRVSYNHAFTLESHLKSVLHQTRSRNAINTTSSSIAGNSAKKGICNLGNNTTTSSVANSGSSASVPTATSSSSSQGGLTSLSGATKDGEQSQTGTQPACSPCTPSATAPALSLLSSPVASAQAVSAFLTLLTSSGSPSVSPSLFTAGAGSTTGVAAPQLELIAQQQLLMPLFLNGLQAQNQVLNPESANAILTQSIPLLGLSTAQQALLAQRLSTVQNQGLGLAAGLIEATCTGKVDKEKGETSGGVERLKKELEVGEGEEGKDQVKEEEDAPLELKTEPVAREVMKGVAVKESNEKGDRQKSVPELNCTSESEKNQAGEHNVETEDKEERRKDNIIDGSYCVGHTRLIESEEGEENKNASEKLLDGAGEPDLSSSPVRDETTSDGTDNPTSSSPLLHLIPSHDSKPATNSATKLKPSSTKPCSSDPITDTNDSLPTPAGANVKGSSTPLAPPILSEFQSQVLWAFLESRSEVDMSSPPHDDCEALGREVGLSGEEVRRWLEEARKEPRERSKGAAGKEPPKEAGGGRVKEETEAEEGALTIVETEGGESPSAGSKHAIDLSHGGARCSGRGREKERGRGRESPGEPCLTSDSDNEGEGFYTSVIVTDEESQSGPVREGLASPARAEVLREEEHDEEEKKEKSRGGKVLRSSTVFLSDAEDTDEEEEEDGAQRVRKRRRNREMEREEVDVKRERQDPDVDLELEAQADPPVSVSVDQQCLPNITASGILHPLPLSISLTPFATQFINPYVLSIPPSAIGLGLAEGERDRGRSTFTHFTDSHGTPPPASHVSPVQSLSNGGICESALDLSMGKKHSSASTSSSTGDRATAQCDSKSDGLGLRHTALGVPGAGGLIVVRVKPDALAIPTPNNSVSSNNNRTSTVYIRAAERVSASLMEREREKQQERERERQREKQRESERDREKEREKEQKPSKARRFRDMRRSRTIIQTEQLDVLYGCYFKDPNPGKHEFQRISEWVHLPKKVVQIWFQNMRARERKGEVRFISDGTLAAMGKPLIKFTWPLTLPIFSSSPSPNSSPVSGSGTTGDSAGASPKAAPPKTRPEVEKEKEKKESTPKDSGASGSSSFSNSSPGILRMTKPKPKSDTASSSAPVRIASKAIAPAPEVPVVIMKTRFTPPSPFSSQKRKRDEGEGEEATDEDEEECKRGKVGPGVTNRMVPKISPPINKPIAPGSHKRNGLNDWSPKGSFKINTLSREQLGLSTPRPSAASSTPSSNASVAKSSPQEGAYQHHSSSPRRPRTHLTSLQVSIMQSCYETCPHPNALECETIGTELGLPLKVVQIWFQNTRAKEKRWRLQQQKQSPGTTDSSKKVDTSSGSFLLYSALRANRPILPKPVQLTVLEPSTPPASGQPASRETLRGRCDACSISFESRAAGRTHVFSPRHLATLRSTNFGHPPSLGNSGSGSGSGSSSGSGAATQSSPNPASSTS